MLNMNKVMSRKVITLVQIMLLIPQSPRRSQKEERKKWLRLRDQRAGGLERAMFLRVLQQKIKKVVKRSRLLTNRVRSKGLVIYTKKQRERNRPPNVICRVDAWSKLINELDETRVMAVKAMGFGGLLEIKLNFLPQQLCYWLMSRVVRDAPFIGDMEFPLCLIQVNCVLGLPFGPLQVPNGEGVGEATPELVDVVVSRYGTLQENIDEDGNVKLGRLSKSV